MTTNKTNYSTSITKRLLDLLLTIPGLIVISPVLIIVSLIVYAEDRGPVFFRQNRVGLNGKSFKMFKFRTMIVDAEKYGGQLTVGRDPRITRVGYWLRKFKLDELPQLFNVVTGEMSLVGPRPEVIRYVELYNDEQRQVLKLKPGITDLASIKYSNENDILANSADPDKTYIEQIMPEKIAINLDYATSASLIADFLVILKTIAKIFK